ncbi:universal stress protein [Amycolatopsis endophytica]|uniref:Nucleotide-binding universal stress UspA family protein n=1 Tax=Amycolatopsis endophytica TaxID=860233 RepID=A0A853BB51_9PSEU|nr:universal stress protein [Amycolatopsis endophytica]NYI91917.1 nucleotide-binding universal stress UspA family protein [Amycolatopsis endophytica]
MRFAHTGDTVVVGVDGSPGSRRAVAWGAGEAARMALRLVLAHGFGIPDAFGEELPGDLLSAHQAHADRVLADAGRLARRAGPRTSITVESSPDGPIPLLVKKSDTARMLVLGSAGRSALRDLAIGSTALALAMHGHSPITVVRGPEPAAGTPVVVGVDGYAPAEPAIELAFEEAAARAVPLVAVHVWNDYDLAETFGFARDPFGTAPRQDAERAVLDRSLAPWRVKYPEVAVRPVVGRDQPRARLLDWSARAQLMVAGSRGRGGFRGMLLGSTTQALIDHARCPVLIARSPLDEGLSPPLPGDGARVP